MQKDKLDGEDYDESPKAVNLKLIGNNDKLKDTIQRSTNYTTSPNLNSLTKSRNDRVFHTEQKEDLVEKIHTDQNDCDSGRSENDREVSQEHQPQYNIKIEQMFRTRKLETF